ncbi:hypothetical protein KY330_02745 [Candidatus Woesearchaeota archaeon]|nr:hypothetical protein [Candidatus Woesearchaeota archaeon]
MNKKAMFFSIMAVVLVGFFVSSIPVSQQFILQGHGADIERVDRLNSLIREIESGYMEGLVAALAERSLHTITVNITGEGHRESFNVQDRFSEVFLNGSIEDVQQDLMSGYDLKQKLDELAMYFEEVTKADFNAEVKDVSIRQNETWKLNIIVHMDYNVTSELASWKRNVTVISNVSILGMMDPLYAREGINRTIDNRLGLNITDAFAGPPPRWTLDRIKIMNDSMLFAPNELAPSYLDRLAGDYRVDSECCGYESFLNNTVRDKTRIDHRYYLSQGEFLFWVMEPDFSDEMNLIVDSSRLEDYGLCEKEDSKYKVKPLERGDEEGFEEACDVVYGS